MRLVILLLNPPKASLGMRWRKDRCFFATHNKQAVDIYQLRLACHKAAIYGQERERGQPEDSDSPVKGFLQ
jgi:hypothetical protein